MTSLSVTTAPVIANEADGKWEVREVSRRVEFVLDGRTLSSLLAESGIDSLKYRVTPFEADSLDPVAVLSGRTPYEEWMPDADRVPLLVCSCGDLNCGALTVRLSRHDDDVEWSEWAWENYYEEPTVLSTLPTYRFDAGEYDQAQHTAERLALANRKPVTRMQVRTPGPWWRNIVRHPSERTDARAMLGWLNAEAITPTLADATGDYADFLISLDWAQTLLAGEASSKGPMSDELRAEAVKALTEVSDSRHRDSLPHETLRAVRWHLERLRP